MKFAQHHISFFLFPVGWTLLLALAFFQEGTALSLPVSPSVTPTPDRLAPPPLPDSPSQADYGAQEYWFQCMPCHGDRGQGLTDEFRMLYPPEEQNCWESGCHGIKFYENGWTIPQHVPALIGPGTLQKFPNAFTLHAYIKASMPFQWPGSLDDETAWQLTAFLMRENGFWNSQEPLTPENSIQILIPQPTHTEEPTLSDGMTATQETPTKPSAPGYGWIYGPAILIAVFVFALFTRLRPKT